MRSNASAGKEHRQARERRKGNGGFRDWQSPRRLSQQDGHVPAQRQDRAPDLRKGIHADRGKADAGVAECRRGKEARKSEPVARSPARSCSKAPSDR